MALFFSILTTVYVTSTVAGLAYQQVKPILDYVPSVAAAIVNVIDKLKEHWQKAMLSEERQRVEQAKSFVAEYQPLAHWILRKLAARLIFAWGMIGASLAVVLLGIGVLLHFYEIERTVLIAGRDVRVVWIFLLPLIVALWNLPWVWSSNPVARIRKSFQQPAITSLAESLTNQWISLSSVGSTMYADLADVRKLTTSLSSISKEERVFIQRYIGSVEWLKMIEAMSANTAWRGLGLGQDVEELVRKGDDHLNRGEYVTSYSYYAQACNLLEQEDASKLEKGRPRSLEPEIHFRLGQLLARGGEIDRAIQEFEKAIQLDREIDKADKHREAIFSPNNSHIAPIREKEAFREFTRKYTWKTYESEYGYAIRYPSDLEGASQGLYSWHLGIPDTHPDRAVRKFIYISVIPEDFQGDRDVIIGHNDSKQTKILLSLQIGESKSLRDYSKNSQEFTYTRLQDRQINHIAAFTYEKTEKIGPFNLWRQTKEIRYYLQSHHYTYVIGRYLDATDSKTSITVNNELFDQIIATFRLSQ